MYGGPRNPNSSPFQGRSRPLSQNFRPRFENPGFPPQPHPNASAYWDFRPRQPYPPSTHFQRPFGMIPHPQEPGGTFQPREWAVPRRGFPPAGNHDEQRTRGRGGHRRNQDSSGIEAYYRHSMVEDPWKELEQQHISKNQQA